MLLFLLAISVISAFGEETLIVNKDSPKITIEWTKTEKLSLSIPLLENKGTDQEHGTMEQTTTLEPITPWAGSETTQTWSTTVTEHPATTVATSEWDESTTGTPRDDLTTTTTDWNGTSSESAPESTTTAATEIPTLTTTAEQESATTTGTITSNDQNETSTERTSESSTTNETPIPTTAKQCVESEGRDFIFLLDSAAMKDREKTTQLMEGFFTIVESDPCNQCTVISYAQQNKDVVRVPLVPISRIRFETVREALLGVNYTTNHHLPFALSELAYRILDELPWRARQRIVVVIATAEGSANESWIGDHQDRAAGCRAVITEKYGAGFMLVTIGKPLFPMFQFVAPDDETVKIDSFENFSMQPISELCCRFAVCNGVNRNSGFLGSLIESGKLSLEESEMCKLVKAREIAKKTVYPICDGTQERERDFVILLDRSSIHHKEDIVNLTLGFVNLINPMNTKNRLHLASYGNDSRTLITVRQRKTNEQIAEVVRSIDYEEGSRLQGGLWGMGYAAFGHDGWRDTSRDRVIAIVASGTPSLSIPTQPTDHPCLRSRQAFFVCVQKSMADARAHVSGKYGARIFLVTIGNLDMEILKFAVPESEMVKIESFEKITHRPLDEFKRRFCL